MFLPPLYYEFKSLLPRTAQIILRRARARLKARSYKGIWPIDPAAGHPPDGWTGWPEKKTFALVLSHDVETAKGCDQCLQLMKIEAELGFVSSYNFVPEDEYDVSAELMKIILDKGNEVGLHGLVHDGKLFSSRRIFEERAPRINYYLKKWKSSGFHSPCMFHNLDWIAELDIEYDCSTFDTDPFEPQPDGAGTIFPFWVGKDSCNSKNPGYVELPYTLPQDHTLFAILRKKDISIWQEKVDWVAEKGGMVLLNTHPDYMNFNGGKLGLEEYPAKFYVKFLEWLKDKYADRYWHVLPRNMARFWSEAMKPHP